jgi:amidase
MAFSEYGSYDGIGLAELVRKKKVSARELLDEAIARTAKVNPQINAVVVKHYEYAEGQIENGLPSGPFTGVPFLLKDLELLRGTRTTSGASLYENNVADHNSTLSQRFLAAGVTIFGKTSTPEFGLMPTTESRLFGPTRNPWNPAHSSGGSSGGAAAAVRRALFLWRMRLTAGVRYAFRHPHRAFLGLNQPAPELRPAPTGAKAGADFPAVTL